MLVSSNVWTAVRLPFATIRFVVREVRKRFFSGEPPSGRHFLVEASLQEIRAALGRQS